ncbi:MAG: OmpA family protein [Bacteriovoracaceae bacterium]|nr:OmpA family protein [Bacteriovoracaceae bacterium]
MSKCPPCKAGAPAWMASFADMCTLLLTFFVLLLSFAKTETAKYEAAMGSVRNAFGGNVLKAGEVLRPGKSPDDAPTMIESDQSPRPFPIEFLTSEGMLDKHEVNRESDTQLAQVKLMLKENDLAQEVDVYEKPESIEVRLKDKFTFKDGSTTIQSADTQIFERLITMLKNNPWNLIVEGHAAKSETKDPWSLSSLRAIAVAQVLMARGISPERVTVVFYGDSRPQINTSNDPNINDRRVDFMIRKADLRQEGKKVRAE